MTIEEKLICLDFLVKLCKDPGGFLAVDFGVDENKLYIDCCMEYENEDQKRLIRELLNIKDI